MGDYNKTIGEQAANKLEKSAKKNTVKRSAIGSTNESILAFIMQSAPYECDAIRVALNAMTQQRDMDQLSHDERTILNRYMVDGLHKDDDLTPRTVRKYRQKKAGELLKPLSDFLEHKSDIAAASALLSDFATDDELVDMTITSVKQKSGNVADKPAANLQTDGSQVASNSVGM